MANVENSPKIHIIFGASSGIAQAFINTLLEQDDACLVYAISRQKQQVHNTRLKWFVSNYQTEQLDEILKHEFSAYSNLSSATIFNGQLHLQDQMPEKQLKSLTTDYALALYQSNVLTPVACIQTLQPYLNKKSDCVITCLSARIGSISDNQLGGWYSYRASKAALNMMLKTFSIELKRNSPNSTVLLFHPGTTNTPLSKPFQGKNLKYPLFSGDFVAQRLNQVILKLDKTQPISYLDWQGHTIKW